MTFNLNLPSSCRLKQGFQSVCESGLWCWRGSVGGGVPIASRWLLRRFLLLKLVTVLLFPPGAWLPLLVGCAFSLQALLLLRSPGISTKPSTVLLGHLALTDTLLLLHWGLRLGAMLALWMEVAVGLVNEVWWWEAVRVLCKGLQDAHHLASLLLLALVGLEATLVSRWPLQTRRLRTAHSAQFSCTLAWVLVILELLVLQASKLLRDSGSLTDPLALSLTASQGLAFTLSLPTSSVCLRKALWLANSWLHYAVLYNKPQRKNSYFH